MRSKRHDRNLYTRTRVSVAIATVLLVAGACSSNSQAGGAADSIQIDFGRITITSRHPIENGLMSALQSEVQRRFSGRATEQTLSQGLNAVTSFLASDAYRDAHISPGRFSIVDHRLDFDLDVEPGRLSVVQEVAFSGVAGTDTTWLRHILDAPLGVPLTHQWLQSTLERLGQLSHLRLAGHPQIETVEEPHGEQIELVRVVFALSATDPSRFDGIVAASGQGDQTALTGRAALEFGGLFGRDRTVAVQFDRPRPQWRTLDILYRDNGAAYAPLNWSVELSELTRYHRRQTAAADIEYRIPRHRAWSLGVGGLWRRVTPNSQSIIPARVTEASLSMSRHTTQRRDSHRLNIGFTVRSAFSHRRTLGRGEDDRTESRLRLGHDARIGMRLGRGWDLLLSSTGQWWAVGDDAIGPGDEWYLGGAEMLRGYEQQWFAASGGIWGMLELQRRMGPLTRLSTFVEAARLDLAAESGTALTNEPYSYGWAVSLHSLQRTGRLEFAWGRGVSLRDGIIRLQITQSW